MSGATRATHLRNAAPPAVAGARPLPVGSVPPPCPLRTYSANSNTPVLARGALDASRDSRSAGNSASAGCASPTAANAADAAVPHGLLGVHQSREEQRTQTFEFRLERRAGDGHELHHRVQRRVRDAVVRVVEVRGEDVGDATSLGRRVVRRAATADANGDG